MSPNLKVTILRVLKRISPGYYLPDDSLIAEVSLALPVRPTRVEIEDALTDLEGDRHIAAVRDALTGDRKWIITDAGRLALAGSGY